MQEKCIANYQSSQEKVIYETIEPTKIALTCCGDKVIEQTLVLIKSALIFTKSCVHFIIISDVENKIKEAVSNLI